MVSTYTNSAVVDSLTLSLRHLGGVSRFGVSPALAFHLLATTHLSELRLSRLALFTVTHLDKLSIASAIQPQFNPSILPAHAPLQ
jgi:hypothetical protein